jgi:aldose 1-epimerase
LNAHTIQLGDWELVAVPGRGGALAACRYRGRAILREAMDSAGQGGLVTNAAAYPMVPFCGRIEQGRFNFDGLDYQLAPNFPPEPHTIHGTGWQSSWAIDIAEDKFSMTLVDETLRWPWPFMAQQVFREKDGGLELILSVTNLGERRMPAGLGWHPFFHSDASHLQAGLVVAPGAPAAPPPDPFWGAEAACKRIGEGVETADLHVDAAFLWPERSARMEFANLGRVTLECGHSARALTVFRPPGAAFVAVEPQTHVPGAHARSDPEALGLRVLAPGESLQIVSRLSIS